MYIIDLADVDAILVIPANNVARNPSPRVLAMRDIELFPRHLQADAMACVIFDGVSLDKICKIGCVYAFILW